MILFENKVPETMSEQEFWTTYISIRHFYRERKRPDQQYTYPKHSKYCTLIVMLKMITDDIDKRDRGKDLANAIEESEQALLKTSNDARAHVPITLDIGANDSVFNYLS